MNLSSEPSIETLPEHYANGIDNSNVINDQTIANFCSELNNLTEELHHTDLENDIDIRTNNQRSNGHIHNHNYNHNSFEHTIDSNKSVQNGGIDSDRNNDNNSDHTHAATLEKPDSVNDKSETENNYGNCNNCDVVDSSPFYTHLNQYSSEINLNGETGHRASQSDQIQNVGLNENLNGVKKNGDMNNDKDFNNKSYMLQSVDLRG